MPQKKETAGFPKPSVEHLVFALVIIIALSPHLFQIEKDGWFHLKVGEYMWQHWSIPQEPGTFSYNGLHIWTAHSWLFEFIIYGLYAIGGLALVIFLKAVAAALVFALLYRFVLKFDVNIVLAFIVVMWSALISNITFMIRPHIFTLLFIVLYMLILESRKKKLLIWLPVIMLIWVNLHAGLLFGFAVLAVYIIHESVEYLRFRKNKEWLFSLLKITAVCVLVTFINPFTYQTVLYPFQYVLDDALHKDYMTEWQPTDFAEYPVYTAMLLVFAFSVLFTKRERNLKEMLFFIGLAYASIVHVRHTATFAIIIAPFLAKHLHSVLFDRILKNKKIEKRLSKSSDKDKARASNKPIVFYLIITLLLGFVSLAFFINTELKEDSEYLPVGAVGFMKNNDANGQVHNEFKDGRMYNELSWGGYLIWNNFTVFMDGRLDPYGKEILFDSFRISGIPENWDELVDKYSIDYFVIKTDSELAEYLGGREDWKLVYSDKTASIYYNKEKWDRPR